MVSQKEAHLVTLGDLWFERNKADLGKTDPVTEAMGENIAGIVGSVLEIGCSNGWRLKAIHEKYGCEVFGVEPSAKAIANRVIPDHQILQGTADDIGFPDGKFAVVIFGYCLYAVDPSLWFKVAHEALRVLEEGGMLVIYDKLSARYYKRVNPYPQYNGEETYIFHNDWTRFFTIHPGVRTISEYVLFAANSDPEVVALLQKRYQL